jgi:hypothetical protein
MLKFYQFGKSQLMPHPTIYCVFDSGSGLIKEIRAYDASPQAADLDNLELSGFDYAERGYTLISPRQIG